MSKSNLILLVSSILIVLEYIVPGLWWTAFFGLAGVFVLLFSTTSCKQAFWYGWIVSTVRASAAMAWLGSVYPLSLLHWQAGIDQILVIGVVWVLTAATIGLAGGIVTAGITSLYTKLGKYSLVLIPLVWLGGSILGAIFFSVLTFGPGGYIQAGFSFGFFGYGLMQVDWFNGVAALGGVYALGLLQITGAMVIALATVKRSWKLALAGLLGLGAVVWVCSLMLLDRDIHSLQQRVITIDTNISFTDTTDETGRARVDAALRAAVTAALELEPDIILLPEDTRFLRQFLSSADVQTWLSETASSPVMLVDSSRTRVGDDADSFVIQRATVYDTGRSAIYEVDKQYLVPIGEYVPYLVLAMMDAGSSAWRSRIKRDRSYEAGTLINYADAPRYVPGILFCSEGISPLRVREVVASREMPLILHPVSHEWFNYSALLFNQLDQMLKMNSLWNNVFIIQAGNMSNSNVAWNNRGERIVGTVVHENDLWTLVLFDL